MYAKTLGRACTDDQVEAMAEAGYWAWSRMGPHVVWADLPDDRRERWRMAARAVPAVGSVTGRELREAYRQNIYSPNWANVPIQTRQRWGKVAEAMVRARDGVTV